VFQVANERGWWWLETRMRLELLLSPAAAAVSVVIGHIEVAWDVSW